VLVKFQRPRTKKNKKKRNPKAFAESLAGTKMEFEGERIFQIAFLSCTLTGSFNDSFEDKISQSKSESLNFDCNLT